MVNARFIQSPEKNKILGSLNEQFGITNIPYLLLRAGNEKIRAYSGSLSKDEIIELGNFVNIELIGEYFLREEGELRLSMDGVHLLQKQITKNIVEIDETQFNSWIRGQNIDLKSAPGVKIISHKGNFIGCGKSNGETMFNFVPKERRLKK